MSSINLFSHFPKQQFQLPLHLAQSALYKFTVNFFNKEVNSVEPSLASITHILFYSKQVVPRRPYIFVSITFVKHECNESWWWRKVLAAEHVQWSSVSLAWSVSILPLSESSTPHFPRTRQSKMCMSPPTPHAGHSNWFGIDRWLYQ